MSAALHVSTPVAASSSRATQTSTRGRWVGRILSGIAVLFLVFDAAVKLVASQAVVDLNAQLGWKAHHLPIIGTIEAVLLVVYLIPRTAPLGAILWTGYLGGAIATHLRIDNPLFSHILFPIYVAALLWGGLYLRDERVRRLIGVAR